MSPMVNGYSIYVGGSNREGWVTRVYRDSDDEHLHSAEGRGTSLLTGLREAFDAIQADQRRQSVAGQSGQEERE